MKVLGRAEEGGGIIVQLSYSESNALTALEEALDGKDWSLRLSRDVPEDREVDKVFLAIWQFVKMNFAINHLANELDNLKSIINGDPDANRP